MPKESLNLYISFQSGNSEWILTSLTDKTKALDKATQRLKQTTEAMVRDSKPLAEEQARLQAQMKASQDTINELQKSYSKYRDEFSKTRLDNAIKEYAELKTELISVNTQLAENQKSYKENLEIIRKGDLLKGQVGRTTELDPTNLLTGLNIGSKVSDWLQEQGSALAVSALGDEMGGAVSEILSDTLAGAATGTALGGLGVGTAIGAGLGVLSGIASGQTKILEAEDDAFKTYYNGLYNDVKGRSGETVEAGSTLAGGREQDLLVFKRLFGDEQTARDYLDSLAETAGATPLSYSDLVSLTKTMANYGYESEDILDALKAAGNAGTALGLGTGDITGSYFYEPELNRAA